MDMPLNECADTLWKIRGPTNFGVGFTTLTSSASPLRLGKDTHEPFVCAASGRSVSSELRGVCERYMLGRGITTRS